MEIGPSLAIGPNVLQHVATACELAIKPATIHNQNMVEIFVQTRQQTRNLALFQIVQVLLE